jgi:hypothetical protein
MQFNSVDIKGVEFYQLGKIRDLNKRFAFEQRYGEKWRKLTGIALIAAGIIVATSVIDIVLFLVAAREEASREGYSSLLHDTSDTTLLVVIVLVSVFLTLGWFLLSSWLGQKMIEWGIAVARAPKKNANVREDFVKGLYNRDELISSLDFIFPAFRTLIIASQSTWQKNQIETFFRSFDMVNLSSRLTHVYPPQKVKEIKLELVSRVREFASGLELEKFVNFTHLTAQTETDFKAAITAQIAQEEENIKALRSLVA